MKKLISVLICLLSVIISQTETFAAYNSDPADLNVLALDITRRLPAVRYRLIEGSTLADDCLYCGQPTMLIPIRGSFWLKPAERNPLFTNFAVCGFRFKSLALQPAYSGWMKGIYRIGGEFALMHQMTLDGYINDRYVRLDSEMVLPSVKFPWIEIDLMQVFPDPTETPLQYFYLHLVAVPWPAMWFSTEQGFHPSDSPWVRDSYVSDGDLLSSRGTVFRTNHQLTSRLGIMPVVPDLGLDAVLWPRPARYSNMCLPRGEIWFSTEDDAFSETLGELLGDGDVLSNAGRIIRRNIDLISRFSPQPPMRDYGLDAVAFGPEGRLLFSTEEDFFSESLGVSIGHGDLLCEDGHIFKRVGELMANFQPIEPRPIRFGLDAVHVWPHREIWFSTETSFVDGRLGQIGHGDLLSDTGRVVLRNSELVGPFEPVEDLDDFGLDSLQLLWPSLAADLNLDGRVDLRDFAILASVWCTSRGDTRWNPDFDISIPTNDSIGVADLSAFAEHWLLCVE